MIPQHVEDKSYQGRRATEGRGFFLPWGRGNSLKRLKSAKDIQGNTWFPFDRRRPAWPDSGELALAWGNRREAL